ncbi:MAG: BglII/BstYI family type II restriction endonuclease [Acidobacteriota bacterium]
MNEIRHIVTNFHLHILEEKDANSSGTLRKMIDKSFVAAGGWKKTVSGGIDWLKCKEVNNSKICVGVEVQVSSRSDLIFRDLIHFRHQIIAGAIDLCALILPSDRLQRFLPDRTPSM